MLKKYRFRPMFQLYSTILIYQVVCMCYPQACGGMDIFSKDVQKAANSGCFWQLRCERFSGKGEKGIYSSFLCCFCVCTLLFMPSYVYYFDIKEQVFFPQKINFFINENSREMTLSRKHGFPYRQGSGRSHQRATARCVIESGEAQEKLECPFERHAVRFPNHSANLWNRSEGSFCQWATIWQLLL